MTDITDEALVRRHRDLTAYLDAEETALVEKLKPWKEQRTLIEGEMLTRLNDRKANNSKTDAGIFFKKTSKSTRVVDKVVFLDHVFALRLNGSPNAYDMLTQAVAKDSVLAWMKDHDGEAPPGVKVEEFTKIEVRKG